MKKNAMKTKNQSINDENDSKKANGNKLLDSLQAKAAKPKTVVWDSCCRIISDD